MRLVILISFLALLISAGCAREAKSGEPPVGTEPITPVAETSGVSAEGMLAQAKWALDNASSFEITRTTVRDRAGDDDSEDVTQVKISGDSGSYIYLLHGRFINESLVAGGLKYARGRYIGQEGAKWEEPRQADPRDIEHARSFIRDLNEITEPRLVGIRERGDSKLYVLEGVSPIPITLGGIDIQARIEPGTYTLEVDSESMAPVRLVYNYVNTIYIDGTPSPDSRADTTVSLEFASVNGTVMIAQPTSDEVIRPDGPEPMPDERYPATPTPPTRR